jgi:DNA polymerase-1
LQYDDGSEEGANLVTGASIPGSAKAFLTLAIGGDIELVGQNVAYDMAVLANASPELLAWIFEAYDRGAVHCTRTRERLLDLAKGNTGPQTRQRGYYSMDSLIERRGIPIKVDKSNPWRVRYNELEEVPVAQWPEEALEYALTDPKATLLIFQDQAREAVAIEYAAFEKESARQAGFDFALNLMGVWGVRTSQSRVKELLERTTQRLSELHVLLVSMGIMTRKGSKSTSRIRELVKASFEQDGRNPPTTGKGAIKTDRETLEQCSHHADLKYVVEHAYLTKLRSTYVLKLIEGINGNIHTSFHVLGADTGRTSSSGPNLQNQSNKGGVRECFVPRKGFVYLGADYDAQELRTLAQACVDLCKYSKLAERFRADPDFDPHTAFACGVMGWDYGDAMQRKAAGDKDVKQRRQEAKAANFGFPGGLGAKNFRSYARGYGVDLDLEEATRLRNQWFEQWPEMTDYFAYVKWVAEAGKLTQLRSNRVRGDVGFCDGANSFFQGLASEASKTAVFLVSKACYAKPDSPLYGCRPVMLVHDEIIIEAPESYAHEAALELQKLMVEAMEMWCPDVPARATPTLARCWSKSAEPVWENGRLVPWDIPPPKDEEQAA